MSGRVLTLESRSDGAGELEAAVDSGADACAVYGASTLVRPQRATSLEHKTQTTMDTGLI